MICQTQNVRRRPHIDPWGTLMYANHKMYPVVTSENDQNSSLNECTSTEVVKWVICTYNSFHCIIINLSKHITNIYTIKVI